MEAGPAISCVAGPGVTTLYEGAATTFAVGRERVVIVSDSLLSVPLAGGAPMVLATPSEPQGLFVLGSTAYYQEWKPPGDVVGGGGVPLMAVPITGGAPSIFVSAFPAFTMSPGATDATSYYFSPASAVGKVGGLSKLTPPSTTLDALTTEQFIASSVAPYGEYVYFIGTDTALTTGFIGRVPKRGGGVEHLVSDIGVPVRTFTVDESGLYWVQPLGRWADGIHRGAPYVVQHAGLDGSQVTQILNDGPNSIAASHGQLYFTTSHEIDRVAATGGPITTVAKNQDAPTMLTIACANLVWANGLDTGPDGGSLRGSRMDGAVRSPDGSASGPRDGSVPEEASMIHGEGGGSPKLTRIVTACIPE